MSTLLETRQARFNQIIHDTPLISDAIKDDQISLLSDQLIGMFNLRNELITLSQTNPDAKSELIFLEETMGRIISYLGSWHGIDEVASKLYLQGIIRSRGDVLRIVAPILDFLDGKDLEGAKVPLIGIVGPIASGKGTIGDVIAEKYNGLHLPLSDRLRELAVSKGSKAPHSRELLRQINDNIKPRFGNPTFVRWTIDMASRLAAVYQKEVMSMDGFRSLEEAQLFKERGGILLGVTASFETRYQRLLERNRGADDFNREAFSKSDQIERTWIDPILEIANVVINNEESVEQLETEAIAYLDAQFE